MGFFNWYKEQQEQLKQSEPEQQTLDLGFTVSSQKPVKKVRVDGIKARDDLEEAIANKGGNRQCQRQVVEIQTQLVFGCSVDEIYEGSGGKKGNRSTLPDEVQKAYITSDTVTAHAINSLPEASGTQEQDNKLIKEQTREVNQKLAGFFPWNW